MQEPTRGARNDERHPAAPAGDAARGASAPSGWPAGRERRDVASRQRLLRRVEMEYAEMPGLTLTAAQARRLFMLREDICLRVLSSLVDAGILRHNDKDAYVFTPSGRRRDAASRTPPGH